MTGGSRVQRTGSLVSVWGNSEDLHVGSAGLGPLSSLHPSSVPALPCPAALTLAQVLLLRALPDKSAHRPPSQSLLKGYEEETFGGD